MAYYLKEKSFNILFIVVSLGLLFGCESSEPEEPVLNVASITTAQVTSIGSTYAIGGGEILNDGGSSIKEAGIVWSTEPNPTVELSTKTKSGTMTGSFTANISPLNILSKYYVRAYATNAIGTTYGDQVEFMTTNKGSCLVNQYTLRRFNIRSKYLFVYDASERIDIFGVDPQYKYRYKGDSIYINNYLNGQIYGINFTSASSNGKVQSIKKYFPDTGGVYRYSFDYSIANQITITLENYSSYIPNSLVTKVAKGEYKLDNLGNVTQLNTYIPFPNSLGDWVLEKTTTYTYDKSENPVRGLIVPFFNNQLIPPVYYISPSNVLTETTGASTISYTYQYAANGLPLSALATGSSQPVFEYTYIKCPF